MTSDLLKLLLIYEQWIDSTSNTEKNSQQFAVVFSDRSRKDGKAGCEVRGQNAPSQVQGPDSLCSSFHLTAHC